MNEISQNGIRRLAIAANILWLIIIFPMSLFMAVDPFYFAIVLVVTTLAIPVFTIRGISKYREAKARNIAVKVNIFGAILVLYSLYAALNYEYLSPPTGMNFIDLGTNFSIIGLLIIIFNIFVLVVVMKKNERDDI